MPVFDGDWLRTGDVGLLDAQGQLRVRAAPDRSHDATDLADMRVIVVDRGDDSARFAVGLTEVTPRAAFNELQMGSQIQ